MDRGILTIWIHPDRNPPDKKLTHSTIMNMVSVITS